MLLFVLVHTTFSLPLFSEQRPARDVHSLPHPAFTSPARTHFHPTSAAMGKKDKQVKPVKKHKPEGRFQTTLCGCTDDCKVLFCCLVAPCCLIGKNRARLEDRRCDPCDAACSILPCAAWQVRQDIRIRWDIPRHRCYDCFECLLCCPLFVCQNARELKARAEDAEQPEVQEMHEGKGTQLAA